MISEKVSLVIMAAGVSSRFEGRIKQLAKVGPNNETLIEYSINQAIKSGIDEIILIVGEKTEKPFKDLFKDNYKKTPIKYAIQEFNKEKRDRPWGTVDALCSARDFVNNSIIVCNGDDIYGEEPFRILVNHLKKGNKTDAAIGYKLVNGIPEKGKTHRALFKVDKDNYLIDLKEIFNIEKERIKEMSLNEEDPISMNVFGLTKETFSILNKKLERFKEENENNRTVECLLPDEIGRLIKNQKIKMKLYPTDSKWIGVTNPEDEELVRNFLKKTA